MLNVSRGAEIRWNGYQIGQCIDGKSGMAGMVR